MRIDIRSRPQLNEAMPSGTVSRERDSLSSSATVSAMALPIAVV